MKMSNSFMSPLPTFTLESLVTSGQWVAAQNIQRKKISVKVRNDKPKTTDKVDTSKSDDN
jgi:hypothetical protein